MRGLQLPLQRVALANRDFRHFELAPERGSFVPRSVALDDRLIQSGFRTSSGILRRCQRLLLVGLRV